MPLIIHNYVYTQIKKNFKEAEETVAKGQLGSNSMMALL